MFLIEEELKKLPGKPGVYIMHGEKDEIIYVGKAVSLKNRVRQYFQSSRNKGAKIEQMVTHIARFEYIITDSELEALVLESNLIKEHRPKYNTMLKDDKSYPFIKVTVQEAYPRVLFARRMKKDKNRYFGPYTSGGAVKDVIELVRKLYQVRSCNRNLPRDCGKDRPCLYYHMKQCMGPCTGHADQRAYKENIQKVIRFLNGDFQETIDQLTEKMQKASEEMRFEDAAEARDLIRSIQKIGERQKITNSDGEDKDVIALAMDKEDAVAQVFFIRNGKLIGREHYYLRIGEEEQKSEVLLTFMKQFYSGTPFIPREIMISEEIAEQELMEEYLSSKRGQKVRIRVPKKGSKEKMVELAKKRQKRYADHIEFCVADATNETSLMALKRNKPFTKAVSNMAVMDITDIKPLFTSVYKLLEDNGVFVFATQHPCFVTLTEKYMTPHSYYDIAIEGQPQKQCYYHRSLQDIFNLCFDTGFVIDGFYEECYFNKEIPDIIIVRAIKIER